MALRIALISAFLAMAAYGGAHAQADDRTARAAAAERYLAAIGGVEGFFRPFFHRVTEETSDPAERDRLKAVFDEVIDSGDMKTVAIDSMTAVFTVEELDAMTDFYGSEAGRSVMRKMPEFAVRMQPAMEQAVREARQRVE